MKRWTLWFVIAALLIGFLSTASCKRKGQPEPDMTGPAGFRIILSGTANPSTLYVPESQPAVYSVITITALNNDGSPVVGKDVIFQESGFGYFENYQISDVRTTDGSGVVRINYFIPPNANVKANITTYITAILVDDGRLDSSQAQIRDNIPIIIIPYKTEGVVIHGHVLTPAGNGVGEVVVELLGADGHARDVTVTRSSGSYEFYVIAGWYGTITPSKDGYSFIPTEYSFTDQNPVYMDMLNLDFTAIINAGNNLAVDIDTWDVGPEGGTQKINVYNSTGDSSISYLVVPNANWLTVTPSSGSTPGDFTILADENKTGEDRSATVTVVPTDAQGTEVTITVNQTGTEVSGDATLAVDRQTLNLADDAIAEENAVTISVYNSTTDEQIDYLITPNDAWIHVTETTGTTDDSFGVYVDTNTGAARTGTITLTATSTGVSNPTLTITVNQDVGGSIAVRPTTINASAAGNQNFSVSVYNATNSDILNWTVTNDETWIKILPLTGQTNESFTVTVQGPNPTSSVRSGVITITADNGSVAYVTVYQNGS